MNYTFRLDDGQLKDPPRPGRKVGVFFMDEAFRPQKNQELILPVSTDTWRVVRIEPPNNPTGQSNTVYIEKIKH